MKIGMILDKSFPPDVRVFNEANILASAGHMVYIMCLIKKDAEIKLPKNIFLIDIKISKSWKDKSSALIGTFLDYYSYQWARIITNKIREFNFDRLHVHDLNMAKAAIIAKKNTGIPVLVDLHENYPAAIMAYKWATKFPNKLLIRPKRWKKLEKKYLQKVDGLIVLSEYFKETMLFKYKNFKPENIIVYPNIPSREEFDSYPVNNEILDIKGRFTLFYFGGVAERRGIFTVLEAIKNIKQEIPNILLLIIGPVDREDKKRFDGYLKNPELCKHIIYFSWKDISLFPSYCKLSDICISPIIKNDQHNSGVANKVYQYMLCGKSVIVSNSVPQENLVVNNKCGLSFQSENEDDFAEKVLYLYSNEDIRKQYGENAKKLIENHFCIEEYSKEYLEYYEKVFKGNR